MDDQTILKHIGALVDEEHEFLQHEATASEDAARHVRLADIEETLDVLWDLLRRRRAARREGLDPDDVQPRNVALVEQYLQ